MHRTHRARTAIFVLLLSFVLSALPALAAPPCGCNFCQRFPDRTCTIDGNDQTCLEFLIVALCPARAEAQSSDETFVASLSAPTQAPAGDLTLAN